MSEHHPIFEILHQALESGESIEIEGVGAFRKTPAGEYELSSETRPRVFVAYVIEDLREVRRLCAGLTACGCSPWLDRDELLPGQNWRRAIQHAIETADFVVACFSRRSTVKRSQFQSELRQALDCARKLPLDRTFLIPVRLERCEVPAQLAEQVQYVNLFPDWERGIRRLAKAMQSGPRRASPVPK